jgi:ribonucleotide reductase alpha subunit
LPYFRLSATFANSINFVLVALIAELEATKKAFSEETALAEEKATQLIVDRSFAEENAARQLADQYLWASEEAKAALPQDLLSVQASLTATLGKLASMSSALDFVVDQECLVEIKLQTAKEKSKA